MEANLPDPKNFFILYRPKDIVSGDFYFAQSHTPPGSNDEILYICTADCTGHGVPGALMSMLGISHLNETITEKNILRPDAVLNDIRDGIITALNPEGSDEEAKDGMDCVLCAYQFKKMKLEFAAANNPLWVVRKNELIEYKADRMPVGISKGVIKPFTHQEIELMKGDIIYTFSDGYADQFGGPKGKKFTYKRLEEKFLEVSIKPMEEQKIILEKSFDDWKGSLEQIDDVLVIGVRI
ncbi:MAG: SpoIIE family protein phosphatase [Bacteroidetes bacterium]|nr:SpoIIE family protein phosphatase [Bacteroidota bacterium]